MRCASAFLSAIWSAPAGTAMPAHRETRAPKARSRVRGERARSTTGQKGNRPALAGATTRPEGTVRAMSEEFRIEHDSMGDVRVPARAKWQAQTQRAVENFPISGLRVESALISALAGLKGSAAVANARLKVLDKDVADAIASAAAEVAGGDWEAEFPVDVYQTGS